MLSGNRIIFLDEPSTGMDPNTRRSLWAAIEEEKNKEGRALLLTTHSMEEAEQACSRIGKVMIELIFLMVLGIMVNGKLNCLGTKQQLKNRYGNRYFIFVQCKEERIPDVDKFIHENFPSSSLQEVHGVSGRKYDVGHLESLGKAFSLIEGFKKELEISEYSITQTTLEQVFLHFAKQQEERSADGNLWDIAYVIICRNVYLICI